jgi:hypothetical protein
MTRGRCVRPDSNGTRPSAVDSVRGGDRMAAAVPHCRWTGISVIYNYYSAL